MSAPAAAAEAAHRPAAAPAERAAQAGGAPPATPPAPAAAVAPAQPAAASAAPLEENGLVAQILVQVDRWNDGLEIELRQVVLALRGLPAMLQRFAANVSDPAAQALLAREFLALAAVFAIGLGLEWMLRRALRRPRKALIDHAEQMESGIPAHAPRRASAADSAGGEGQAQPDEGDAEAAGAMRPPVEGVALVRSQRDGVDRVDAVVVDAPPHAGRPRAAAHGTTGPAAGAQRAPHPAVSSSQWGRLRQLPFAIGVLLIDLLPLTWFFFVIAVSLHWLGQSDDAFRHMVRTLVGAYVGMRAAMAVLRLLVAPGGCGVPVVRVSRNVSGLLYRWLRRMIVTAACGISLAGVAGALGASVEARLTIMKAASLLVHLFAVILIVRLRRPVGAMIAAPHHAGGPLAAARNWMARAWATFAAVLVMGVWVVWALGVQDGFQKLLHFIGVTAGVIIAARILAILILGALGRIFHAGDMETAAAPDGRSRSDRYYPLMQRLVVIGISACTAIVLLQAWGIDVIGWLTLRPIGRRLLAAILTIAVAVIVGVVIWEVSNAAVERRLAAWNAQGDKVRAARLRTLLPILRTCLFVVIVLVVGLTALNEIGINTTPLLAGASIVGVALGFGSQKLVQDFITGIFLLMENAMQVGDWVTVAGVSGTVEDLSIRTVRLRAGDGSLHIVPFSSVTSVNNSNRGLGNAVMRVSVSYGSDIDLVTQELRQIGAGLRADPNFQDNIIGDLEIWGVDAVDGSTVTLAGQMRCTDRGRWGVQRELNRRILERFRQLGIQIADPRATVLLPREVAPPVVSAVQQPAAEKNTQTGPAAG